MALGPRSAVRVRSIEAQLDAMILRMPEVLPDRGPAVRVEVTGLLPEERAALVVRYTNAGWERAEVMEREAGRNETVVWLELYAPELSNKG